MGKKINTDKESEQVTKYRGIRKEIFIGLGCLAILVIGIFVVVVFVFSKIHVRTGKIDITNVVLTTGIDEQGNPLPSTNHFPSYQTRIYCYVSVSSPKPISIGVRWYYEDTLIYTDTELVDGWKAFYIEPLPGERYKDGEYKVEIYLVDKAVRTIYYIVGN